MRAQFDHLADDAALPNVVIRVLPFDSGAHPAMNSGAFSVLEFSHPEDPHIAYLAQLTSGIYLDTLREVGTYRLAYEQLRAAALGPQSSSLTCQPNSPLMTPFPAFWMPTAVIRYPIATVCIQNAVRESSSVGVRSQFVVVEPAPKLPQGPCPGGSDPTGWDSGRAGDLSVGLRVVGEQRLQQSSLARW